MYVWILVPLFNRVRGCLGSASWAACDANLGIHLKELTWFAAAGAFYASNFPERLWPGHFDILAHGHQVPSLRSCLVQALPAVTSSDMRAITALVGYGWFWNRALDIIPSSGFQSNLVVPIVKPGHTKQATGLAHIPPAPCQAKYELRVRLVQIFHVCIFMTAYYGSEAAFADMRAREGLEALGPSNNFPPIPASVAAAAWPVLAVGGLEALIVLYVAKLARAKYAHVKRD